MLDRTPPHLRVTIPVSVVRAPCHMTACSGLQSIYACGCTIIDTAETHFRSMAAVGTVHAVAGNCKMFSAFAFTLRVPHDDFTIVALLLHVEHHRAWQATGVMPIA